EVLRREAGDQRGADVQQLDRHRLAVRQTEALYRQHGLRRRHVEDAAEARAGRYGAQVERPARRLETAAAHVVAERRDVRALLDLRCCDEGARTATAHQVSLAHQLVERRPHGEPRHAEVGHELPLGRDRVVDGERRDQLEDALAGLPLLRHPAGWSSAAGTGEIRSPLSGSKKWKRAGSTASSSRPAGRAAERTSTRATNNARSAWSRPPASAAASR